MNFNMQYDENQCSFLLFTHRADGGISLDLTKQFVLILKYSVMGIHCYLFNKLSKSNKIACNI